MAPTPENPESWQVRYRPREICSHTLGRVAHCLPKHAMGTKKNCQHEGTLFCNVLLGKWPAVHGCQQYMSVHHRNNKITTGARSFEQMFPKG